EPVIRSHLPGWSGVNRGLLFMTIGAGLYMLLFLILFLMTSSKGGPGTPGAGKAMVILLSLLFVGATGLGAAGLGGSISVPSNSGVRGIGIGGTVGMGIATLTGTILVIAMLAESRDLASPTMLLFLMCGLWDGFLFTHFFMAILAKHIKQNALQASVVGMAGFWAIAFWLVLGVESLGANFAPGMGGGMGGLHERGNPFSTLLLIVIAAGAWFIVNAILLGNAINKARRQGEI